MMHSDFNQNDEVSLKEFKSHLNQSKHFLKQISLSIAVLVKKYFILLLLLGMGFAALAVYQYKYSRSYTAKASYLYIESQKKTYGEMVDKLGEMLKTRSYDRIAQALHISLPQAQSIYAIDAVNVRGAKLSEDITEDTKSFYISVSAGNNTVFDTLQTALLYYLNNNIHIRQRMIFNRTRIEQDITYLKGELARMDSLKVAYTNSLGKQSTSIGIVSGTPFNPVEIYEKSEKINRDISDEEALLNNNYQAVQVLDGFMVSQSPSQTMTSFAIKCFIYYLVCSFLLLFVISIFKN
jgi:hypothetical protein